MSKKLTNKAIKALSEPKLAVGYNDLQYLLKFETPFAHTEGTYGWNYNAYDLDGLVVCMGYRNMPGYDADDLVREYQRKALDATDGLDDPDQEKALLDPLIAEFREKVLERIA